MASSMPLGHGNMAHTPGGGGHQDGPGGGGPLPNYASPAGPGQHHQQGQGTPGGGGGGGPQGQGQPQQQQQQQQAAAAKELNAAMLCRFGQETVQEIVARSLELFQLLKQTQPPDGKMNSAIGMDRKTKFQETLKTIKANFKRLRVIYEKIEENFPSNKEIPFEEDILNKSDDILAIDDKRNTESYKQAVEEYKEAIEHLMIKNRHLKDAIDHLRTMIWDVNTMLAMRKE